MKFSECLIRLRKENNFSQDALAELLNVTRQTISKWENGDCMPDAAKLIRLSEIFHISIDELCGKIIQSSPSAPGADGGAAAEPEHADKKVGFIKILLVAAAVLCIGLAAGIFTGMQIAGAQSKTNMAENESESNENGAIIWDLD